MEIHSFNDGLVILADEGSAGKLTPEQIRLCEETKKLLVGKYLLPEFTYVMNEEGGTAPETTGILLQGLEYPGMHEESFSDWNDSDNCIESITNNLDAIKKNPEITKVCIICGHMESFLFMKTFLTNNNSFQAN